jgi:aryl-alcohol dehydrogenase-like predicted oxidoreductase
MSFREHTTLGRTGLKASRLGIGAGYGVPTSAVEHAFHEFGVNYLYWSLSRRSGMTRAIRNLAPAHRDELVIAMQTYDHSGFFLRGAHERGLRTLGIERADVLILGWFNRSPSRRVLDAACRLQEEGKVGFLAMSGHKRTTHAAIARMEDSPIDILMVRYNPAHRGAEIDVFPHLPEQDPPGVTIYTATRWRQLLQAKRMPPGEQPLEAVDCYRFALSNPHVDLVFTGPRDEREMKHALGVIDSEPLSAEELERIRRIGDHVHG